MEPVTHFLTGAVLARSGFNRRTAYATLAMTLAAEAPDLDVIWAIRGPVAALEHHRGITHTFLGAPFVALAVTATVYLYHRLRTRNESKIPTSTKAGAPRLASETWEATSTKNAAPFKPAVGLSGKDETCRPEQSEPEANEVEGPAVSPGLHKSGASSKRSPNPGGLKPNWLVLWLFSLVAVLSHLLLDFTNNYGLRPFFPFNPRWYAWSIVSIIEPLMLLALLTALILPAIFGLADREIGARRQPFRGRGWAIAALAFIVVLYGVRNAEHRRALALLSATSFGQTGKSEAAVRLAAMPYPVNPFHWRGLAETADFYQAAAIDTRADIVDSDSTDITYKPPVTLATLAAKRSYLGHVYLDWSSWPLVADLGSEAAPAAEALADLPVPPSNWTSIEFRDLRFTPPPGSERTQPLSGWVYVGPGREIEAMIMSGREQK